MVYLVYGLWFDGLFFIQDAHCILKIIPRRWKTEKDGVIPVTAISVNIPSDPLHLRRLFEKNPCQQRRFFVFFASWTSRGED